ncbi:filamentous hemagglutinin family protein [Sodalis ligni]|uniref:filamentous haemagglutinin family protein n=1 Tax=Sodalis ligni TaxID=2697027 RepID=UPI001BDF2EA3|nr:filamentous haemagglutinin family protein [Sodalis ligni]QWA10751.1 filamentous hemagglutinin family protein [Sodalis ligni]
MSRSDNLRLNIKPIAYAIGMLLLSGAARAAGPRPFTGARSADSAPPRPPPPGAAGGGGLPGMPPPLAQQQQANAQLARSIANLGQTAAAIAAAQAQQAAARQAALNAPGGVPDGLASGGLQVDNNPATQGWLNAAAPTQSSAGGHTTVSINQTKDKAILNWQTFNVGKNTEVDFHQQASWAVLNRVNDPNARPSQIEGQIKGDGTVLLMNRNGIVFSGSSQVNVRNLVAAAAAMSDDQFTAHGIYGAQTGGLYTPSFTNAGGALTVEPGAVISTSAPASVTQGGGYVLLMGQQVSNAGDIETPQGQAELAAGDNFIIRRGVGTDANPTSTTRGNEISPQLNPGTAAGQVDNTGLLVAREGDITLAGHNVQQNGAAIATTTVNTRGTIHLLNSDGDAAGRVTLGGSAVTAVLIDDDGKTTALDSQRDALSVPNGNGLATGQFDNLSTLADRRDQSRVEIVSGGDVVFTGGSMTLATGGQIAVSAAGRAFVADGANLDVSGAVGVQVAMDSSNLLVNVQGNELRDAPANRDSGKLANSNVWVDTSGLLYVPAGAGGDDSDRWYTAGGLLEVGGYLSNQGHRIGEWAALGGTVALSGREVVTQSGSRINISGGSIDTATGYLQQTWLKGPDGQLYNVNSAPADLMYTGIFKGFEEVHARWGDTSTEYFRNPLIGPEQILQNGYTVGRDAGQLIVSSPTAVLEGDVVTAVYNGPRQVDSRPDGVTDGYRLAHDTAALGGGLVVGLYTALGLTGGIDSDMRIGDIGGITQGMGENDALPDERTDTVWLDANSLNAQDLGGLTLISTDQIAIDAPLALATGGQLTLIGPKIDVDADITAHGGDITMGNVMSTIVSQGQTPFWVALNDAQGYSQVTIDNNAKIDLSGLWLNQRDGSDNGSSAIAFLDGGTLNVATTGGVTFAAGSLIDVSSGAAVLASGETRGGKGGNVSLIANDDTRVIGSNAPMDPSAPLIVDGKIIAYGFNGGGTLTLKAGQTVVIGDDATLAGGHLAAGTPASTSVRLSQDVVIPIGGRIPFDYNDTLSSVPVDTPIASAFTPSVSTTAPIVSASSWEVPAGMSVGIVNSGGNGTIFFSAGSIVPSNATIFFISSIPLGTVIPSSVFPHGIPIPPVLLASYKAGDVVSAPVTLPTGTVVPVGTQFDSSVPIQPVLALGPDIFSAGFSHYAVSSNTGMEIATNVAATVPVYRFDTASRSAPTGSEVSDAADLWLPPTYIDDPIADRLTQRAGASLTFSSLYDFNMTQGSAITVDPGQSVTLYADRQTTIEGAITAHGGNITIANVPNASNGALYGGDGFGFATPTRSIWVGEDSILDVSAQAVVAADAAGRRYGVVPDGGSITLGSGMDSGHNVVAGDAFIIVRPGALLDASGTAETIDVPAGAGLQPTLVAGDGGVIALYSASGIYLDGDLRAAAGGGNASGGLLSLNVLSHIYLPYLPTPQSPFAVGEVPEEMQRLRNITIVQQDRPTGLSAGLAPGESDPALKFGDATLSVDKIHAGGFDQLALSTHDLFVFDGDVDLGMKRSIVLSGGVISASANDPHINAALRAPYVKIDGWYNDPSLAGAQVYQYYTGLNNIKGSGFTTASDSNFEVDADLIDVSSAVQFGAFGFQGAGSLYYVGSGPGNIPAQTPGDDDLFAHDSGPHIVNMPGFGNLILHSSGDVRFGTGSLTVPNSLAIQADQIYPMSGATMNILAGLMMTRSSAGGSAGGSSAGFGGVAFDPGATLIIRTNGEPAPDTPASVFGNLSIAAPYIDQGGVVRAPLGILAFNTLFTNSPLVPPAPKLVLRDGSLTSTSAQGLTIPFGGTSDGVTYQGTDGTIEDLGATNDYVNGTNLVETGLMIAGESVVGEAGAVLDVSGGGNLLGAGFISGRGGSVNVLTTALVNANPINATFSAASDKVYAIAPGYAAAYAPAIAAKGAGDPAVGQQITIAAGVPGLPAGTYTLLPSSYALAPGAFRVELGGRTQAADAPLHLPNGSILASGYLGIANTAVRDSLPTQVILTAGPTVRTYSQYNETGYADFLRGQASLFDGIRPRLPIDGGIVEFTLGSPSSGKALSFAGSALFSGAEDGIAGALVIKAGSQGVLDITAPGAAALPGHTTLSSDDINAFNAASVLMGGSTSYNDDTGVYTGGRIVFTGDNAVNVLDGATLRAGQIFLVGPAVSVAGGATLDTRGLGGSGLDSSLGYVYGNTGIDVPGSTAVLAVANGWFNFLPFSGTGSIEIGNGASLLTEGSIVLGAPGSLTMGDANLGARYLSVTQETVNVGTDASLTAAQAAGSLPAGWNLTQGILDRLLHPSSTAGVPALEQLTIVAGGSVNLFGDVSLDARSQSGGGNVQFVVNSPALYGLANGDEGAHITADAFVWNGIRTGNGWDPSANPTGSIPYGNQDPAVIVPNGPGTGLGTLDIAAQSVLFGYGDHTRVTDGTSLNRYAIGFSAVNISAGDRVTTNDDGALFVGLSRDSSGNVQGGNLTITAPLLTAQQGAVMAYNAGGAITATAPAGVTAANTANENNLGGTISFNGDSIVLDTAVALPSGKLTLKAVNDLSVGGNAMIDLSGRHLTFFDKSADSWGGDLVLQSASGDISLAAGSLLDVSAQNNAAGTVTAMATDLMHGRVLFDGALNGSSSGGYAGGEFTIQAQDLGDFSALNDRLNGAGFFGARSFDIKRGDLAFGNGVKANAVSISVDGGSLTVNGTIDASGTAPGTIRLAARDDLHLASSAVLDTHGTVLKIDSYGAPIEADNTPHIELASADGFVNLDGGAVIDMRSADNTARGRLEIDAPRLGGANGTGAGANDIAINAGAALNVAGAASIAVNGFRTYALPDGGTIDQSYLDGLNIDSSAFINAALGNGALSGRLAGLAAYGSAFHLRPGIEIRSDGTLSTTDDLDFAGYRYGPNANPTLLGSGEPGKLVIRAADDLNINGSITDGFAPPPNSPDDTNFLVPTPSTVAATDIYPTGNVHLLEDWTVPNDAFYSPFGGIVVSDPSGRVYNPGETLKAGTVISATFFGLPLFAWEAGLPIPALLAPGPSSRPVYALAQPLAPGSLSWSMRLVSGADTGAADSRALRSAPDLAGLGNMTLNDPHVAGTDGQSVASVIRTGTGDLDLLAGGNYQQMSPYGIYTAGTPIAATGASANAPYNPARGTFADDGTVLGAANTLYEDTLGSQYMYYMEHGGDLLLTAQGNIDGSLAFDSGEVGGWLWRQGGTELGQAAAWGINFGSYTASPSIDPYSGPDYTGVRVHLSTFSGVGTLGGGNANVRAGGDIGDTGGIVIAVGGSGRVMADGSLAQTGGGTLSVKAGGNVGGAGNQFVDIRGDINLSTGDFGSLYGQHFGYDNGLADPRPLDPLKTYSAVTTSGGAFVPGDGTVNILARGDIAMGDVIDPGRIRLTEQTDASSTPGLQGATWFTLWTPDTAINLFGAGGGVSPLSAFQGSDLNANSAIHTSTLFLPSILRATAGNGDIFLFAGQQGASLMLPSPSGELQLLAAGSVIDATASYAYGPLATSMSTLATPFHPAWATYLTDNYTSTLQSSNYWGDPNNIVDSTQAWKVYSSDYGPSGFGGVGGNPFVFGPNTVSDASAFDGDVVSSIYAMDGDILNLRYGEIFESDQVVSGIRTTTDYYRAVKPVQILAGGDIVDLKGLILQNDPNDVSAIAASGNIIEAGAGTIDFTSETQVAGLQIAGPGTLEISAGKNLYQGSSAAIESIGPLVAGDQRPGASVVLQAGLGAGTPGEGQVDWTAFARLYLDPANLAGPGALADQPGKVAKTYNGELVGWLRDSFGYAGPAGDALAYFLALPAEQQRIFLRTVYYAELTAGGREFNDSNGPRPGSYLRGREAIAALFPREDAYDGDITLFTAISSGLNISGYVHTDFGGDIQLLAPGGGVTIGTEGLTPGADSGLITQGQGDIQIYSQDSLLLGLSRIMTTFGGNILAWSTEGDINAGRGSKTTVVFTPPKQTYDDVGNLTLSPQVPSTGAGIATLAPIPEVPPGDVDLIAPLGTIDAGEAGIRVSGNINVAALRVVNAENIQVQGKSTGIPTIAAVNVGALTSASQAASSAVQAAEQINRQAQRNQPSVISVQVLGYGTERLEAGGDDNAMRSTGYDPASVVQVVGTGKLDQKSLAQLSEDERRSLQSQ